jgi:hypothetical protein
MIDGSPSAVNKTAQICVSIIAGVAMTLLAVLLTQMLWQVLSVLAIVVSPLALFYVGANLNRRVSFVKQRTEYWVRASAAMFFLAAVLSEPTSDSLRKVLSVPVFVVAASCAYNGVVSFTLRQSGETQQQSRTTYFFDLLLLTLWWVFIFSAGFLLISWTYTDPFTF